MPQYKDLITMTPYNYMALMEKFESYLLSNQPEGTPDSLYEPIRYINQLGGKRIRPVLVLMAYNLWHENVTPAMPAAMALEYFHNFSLMHDDIMDEAPLRRGSEAVHKRFGRNAAILSGDAMLIQCFDLLLKAGQENQMGSTLCTLMSKVAMEICEGQQMDMDFESLDSPLESDYLEMIRKKTACLIGLSLQIGAILAGAKPAHAQTLYKFGELIGLGFQVQDDYLDVFGDADLTGKQQGGDILRGKKNFLYVHHYNSLSSEDQKVFVSSYILAAREKSTESIMTQYQKSNVAADVSEIQSGYFKKGLAELRSLKLNTSENLEQFVETLMARNH